MAQITSTANILPQSVISNGQTTGNPWSNPDHLLLVDGLFAESNSNSGSASDVIIGNYNTNIPQNAVITGIEMELIAKQGATTIPALAITIYAVDNTTGQDIFFPYTAPVSLTETLTTYVLGSSTYQFDTSLTPDQINNLKFQLIANGDVYVDSFLLKVFYYIPATPVDPTPIGSNCATCNSPIQVQRMFLQYPFQNGDTKFYLQPGSMTYPDGTPVQPGDIGSCSGQIDFVFDQGKSKGTTDNNFEENVILDLSVGYWTVLTSGVVEVDIGTVNNRGIQFHTPCGHDASLMSDHDANSEVIISNNAHFELRMVRRCEVGTTFSAPIVVQKDNVNVVNPATKLNFKGSGVSLTDAGNGEADITISGFSPIPPSVVNELSFYQNTAVSSYSTPAFSVTGTDRLLMASFTLAAGITPTATWNGSSLISAASSTNGSFTCWVFYLVAPALGSHTLDVTFSGPTAVAGNLIAYTQVDPGAALGSHVVGSGTSTTASLMPTTTTTNATVFHALSTARFPILYTQGGGETLVSVSLSGSLQNGIENQAVGTPATVTTQVSLSVSTAWADIAFGINGIQPTAAVQSVTGMDTDNTDPANPIVKISVDGTTITGLGTPGSPLVAPGVGGSVETVTGLNTDNTDPANPVVNISVDGATITGQGTPGDPLVAVGATGSLYSVNGDETISSWFTTQIRSPHQGTGAQGGEWVYGGTITPYSSGSSLATSGGATAYTTSGLGNFSLGAVSTQIQYDVLFINRLKFIAAASAGVSTPFIGNWRATFFGYSDQTGSTADADITSVIGKRIGFITYNGNLYAACCNGSTITVATISTYTLLTHHLYEIVVDGTTSAKFYFDGDLAATISTNLPTSGGVNIEFTSIDQTGAGYGFDFISNMVYSQKL